MKQVVAINVETGEESVFESVTAASKALSISKSAISKICTGKNEMVFGYTFRFQPVEREQDKIMTRLQAEVIIALAANGLRSKSAGKSIFKTKSAIKYHAETIKKQTGKNPYDFYDMCELLPIAKKVMQEEKMI